MFMLPSQPALGTVLKTGSRTTRLLRTTSGKVAPATATVAADAGAGADRHRAAGIVPPQLPVPNTLQGRLLNNLANIGPLMGDVQPGMNMYLKRRDWYKQLNSETIRFKGPGNDAAATAILSRDPTVFREVLGPKSNSFTNADIFRKVFGFFFKTSVIVTEGEQWQRIRRILKKAIDKQNIGLMVPTAEAIVDKAATTIIDPLAATGQSIDFCEFMSSLTFDAFHTFAYDWNPETVHGKNVKILESCQMIANSLSERNLMPLPFLWYLPTPHNFKLKQATRNLFETTDSIIAQRRKAVEVSGGKAVALLDNMILAASGGGEAAGPADTLSTEELRDNVCTLFFGAYDTTTASTGFMFEYLARHPQYQALVREEVKGLDLMTATVADLEKLTMVQNIFNETMRLKAVAWAFGRSAVEDVVVGGYQVKKGNSIIIDQSALAYVPGLWNGASEEDLGTFRPERWSEFTPKKTSSMPFGFGGRMCPGKSIANVEMATILISMVQRYEWTLDEAAHGPVGAWMQVGLTPRNLWIKFKRI